MKLLEIANGQNKLAARVQIEIKNVAVSRIIVAYDHTFLGDLFAGIERVIDEARREGS